MDRLSPVITLAAAVLLGILCYAFFPWPGNVLGDAGWLGVPLWIACLALTLGLFAVTAHLVRGPRRTG